MLSRGKTDTCPPLNPFDRSTIWRTPPPHRPSLDSLSEAIVEDGEDPIRGRALVFQENEVPRLMAVPAAMASSPCSLKSRNHSAPCLSYTGNDESNNETSCSSSFYQKKSSFSFRMELLARVERLALDTQINYGFAAWAWRGGLWLVGWAGVGSIGRIHASHRVNPSYSPASN